VEKHTNETFFQDGTFFQEGDYICIKATGEKGTVNAIDGGIAYVLMEETGESKLFSAYIDEDAYIKLVIPE
jgi:hypothetical protein